MQLDDIEEDINLLDILAIAVVIIIAFFFQIYAHELPCPLCLLQRVGFLAIGFGGLLNIIYGCKPLHYGLSILAALYTAVVSGRQVLLHIVPGDGGYGFALFGLHLYTWCFIAAIGFILLFILLLIFDKSKRTKPAAPKYSKIFKWLFAALFSLMVLLCLANAITTYLECGFSQCPDNPVVYKY